MGNRSIRRKEQKKKVRKRLSIILFLIICLIVFNVVYGIYTENKIRLEENNNIEKITKEDNVIEQEKIIITKREEVNIPEKYEDFEVCAKLEIPNIKLDTCILNEYTKEGMDVSPTKYWGPEPNEIGNFCITGHNYKKDNMFSELINLNIGDEIFLLDNKNGKYRYIIYDIYKVKPDNTESLNQNTNGKREITLITCVNYSDKRLIIKAKED